MTVFPDRSARVAPRYLSAIAVLVLSVAALAVRAGAEPARTLAVGKPTNRSDRLIVISGDRPEALIAEVSTDGPKTWRPATIYHGTTTDEWRACDADAWNRGVLEGRISAGNQPCIWNYAFDVDMPIGSATLRLKSAATGKAVLQATVDLTPSRDVVVIDRRNVAALAGGKLTGKWTLALAGVKNPPVASIGQRIERKKVPLGGKYFRYAINDPDPTPLVIRPNRTGWHRIYVGMEPYATIRFSLSKQGFWYEVPNFYADDGGKYGPPPHCVCQEFYICSADLTGQDLCLAPGGSRFWRDVSVRYIRLVPMTKDEIAHFARVRDLARTKGRPVAGYLEPVTPAAYVPPGSLTLQDHIRNEMRLNKVRGSTCVYMHVIRIGSKAWYHSDVVERGGMSGWETQGDPMVVGMAEARAAGLKFFADAGMNATYYGSDKEMTARFAREHPELLCAKYKMCFDYRKKPVQDYVVSIVRELMTTCDVDGVNLDFGRWGHRRAYDKASLVAVVERIHEARRKAEKKWGHPVIVSARIDYDAPPAEGADAPVFLAALRTWARAGLVDRIMVNVYKKLAAATNLRPYVDAIAGTKTQLWGDLYWGTWPKGGGPRKDLAIARGWVAQGLDGGFFYYMRARPIEWERINWQLRLVDFPDVAVAPADR